MSFSFLSFARSVEVQKQLRDRFNDQTDGDQVPGLSLLMKVWRMEHMCDTWFPNTHIRVKLTYTTLGFSADHPLFRQAV